MDGLRRRTVGSDVAPPSVPPPDDADPNDKAPRPHPAPVTAPPAPYRETFVVSRRLIVRLVGVMYFFSFLTARVQLPALIGPEEMTRRPGGGGLMSAAAYTATVRAGAGPWHAKFAAHPTVLSWIPPAPLPSSWSVLCACSLAGLALSAAVAAGLRSFVALALLWLLNISVVTVAERTSTFYAYGWESQILETGFLACFLCDLPHLFYFRRGWGIRWTGLRGLFADAPTAADEKVPRRLPALWLLRWLMFRITIGAGLIKIRGSSCWTKKTCLHYHFETQPMPSPLSFVFHFLPKDILSAAVWMDLTVQLYLSWMVLVPGWGRVGRNLRRIGGWTQAFFMINIAASGNYSFLNHLTILPALACLDDGAYPRWVRRMVAGRNGTQPQVADEGGERTGERTKRVSLPPRPLRKAVDAALLLLIAWLSVPVVKNLLQLDGGQAMNASYDPLKLVNTYGAFGSVGERRYEPIVSVSTDGDTWHEIEFPCKPGDVRRRPCFCAPYHYRADWNIWFIGFKPHQQMLQQRESWLYSLLIKMLQTGDKDATEEAEQREQKRRKALVEASGTIDLALDLALSEYTSLLPPPQFLDLLDWSAAAHFPPAVALGPKYAKVDMYHYKMKEPLSEILWRTWQAYQAGGGDVRWWKRKFEEVLVPPVMLDQTGGRLALMPDAPARRN